MSNTSLTRATHAFDDVVASLESFTSLIGEADRDHRLDYVMATAGQAGHMAQQAAGKFYDLNIGAEGFKDNVRYIVEKLVKKLTAWYHRVREFFNSFIGMGVKRIERLQKSIESSSKFKEISGKDHVMTLHGLYGIGFDRDLKEIHSYVHIDMPPYYLTGPHVARRTAVVDAFDKVPATAERCKEISANIRNVLRELKVSIKPEFPDTGMMRFAKTGYRKEFNAAVGISGQPAQEVEVHINTSSFVGGIGLALKQLQRSKNHSGTFSNIITTLQSAIKVSIAGNAYDQAYINALQALVSDVGVYVEYYMTAIDEYINTTFKITASIARACGIPVVAVGNEDYDDTASDIHAVLAAEQSAAVEEFTESARAWTFLNSDNRFWVGLERRPWESTTEDEEAEDFEVLEFTPREDTVKEEAAQSEAKKNWARRAWERVVAMWEKFSAMATRFLTKLYERATGKSAAVSGLKRDLDRLYKGGKLPDQFTYTVPKEYVGYSVATPGTDKTSLQTVESFSDVAWRFINIIKDAERFDRRRLVRFNIASGISHESRMELFVDEIEEMAERLKDSPLAVTIEDSDISTFSIAPRNADTDVTDNRDVTVTAREVFEIHRALTGGELGLWNTLFKKLSEITKNLTAAIKHADGEIKRESRRPGADAKEKIAGLKDSVKNLSAAITVIRTIAAAADKLFSGLRHFIAAAIRAGKSAGTESIREDLEGNNVEVIHLMEDGEEVSHEIMDLSEGLETLLSEGTAVEQPKKKNEYWQRFKKWVAEIWKKILGFLQSVLDRIKALSPMMAVRTARLQQRAKSFLNGKHTLPDTMEYTADDALKPYTLVDESGDFIDDQIKRRMTIYMTIVAMGSKITIKMLRESTDIRNVVLERLADSVEPEIQQLGDFYNQLLPTFKKVPATLQPIEVKEIDGQFAGLPTIVVTPDPKEFRVKVERQEAISFLERLASKEEGTTGEFVLGTAFYKFIAGIVADHSRDVKRSVDRFVKRSERSAFSEIDEVRTLNKVLSGVATSVVAHNNWTATQYHRHLVGFEKAVDFILSNRVKAGNEDHDDTLWVLEGNDQPLYNPDITIPEIDTQAAEDEILAAVEDYPTEEAEPAPNAKLLQKTITTYRHLVDQDRGVVNQWPDTIDKTRVVLARAKQAVDASATSQVQESSTDETLIDASGTMASTSAVLRLNTVSAIAGRLSWWLAKMGRTVSKGNDVQGDSGYDQLIGEFDNVNQLLDTLATSYTGQHQYRVVTGGVDDHGNPVFPCLQLSAPDPNNGQPRTIEVANSTGLSVASTVLMAIDSAAPPVVSLVTDLEDAVQRIRAALAEDNDNPGLIRDAALVCTAIQGIHTLAAVFISIIRGNIMQVADYLQQLTPADSQPAPAQESIDRVVHLRDYLNTRLENGGLESVEATALNMLSNELSSQFGLEGWAVNTDLFYDTHMRAEATQYYIDKLSTLTV